MTTTISELIWDEFNSNHIDKHGVTKHEVYEAINHVLLIYQTYEGRYLLVGKTGVGRLISVVLAKVKPKIYYVITARDSSRGERRKINE